MWDCKTVAGGTTKVKLLLDLPDSKLVLGVARRELEASSLIPVLDEGVETVVRWCVRSTSYS